MYREVHVGVTRVDSEGVPLVHRQEIDVSEGDILAHKVHSREGHHFHVGHESLFHKLHHAMVHRLVVLMVADPVVIKGNNHVDLAFRTL